MTEGELLVALQLLLHFMRQLEQAYVVGNRGAIFAGALRHLLLGDIELTREPVESLGLLHGTQVFALQILNDSELQRLLVTDLADYRRNGLLAGALRSQPAALAGNELETSVTKRTNDDRLHHTIRFDGSGQLVEGGFIHTCAGLVAVAINVLDAEIAHGVGGGLGRRGGPACGG